MKKRTLLLVMVFTLITAMLVTACGGKEAMTLEKYAKDNPEVQESIDSAMADSNVLVEIKGNEIIYTFDLSNMDGYTEELVKDESVVSALESALEAAGGSFGGIAKSIEESTGIQGISTTVNYTWGDDVIVTRTFTAADAADADSGE